MGIETLAIASLAGTLLSTGVGVVGAIGQASAQSASAKYQAQVNENNRIAAEQNARYATQAAQTNAQARDFQTRALVGQEEAAQGASGIDLTTGSPRDVVAGTRQIGRFDTLSEIQKGNLQAYGYRTQATSFGAESQLQRQQAGFATAAGGISAGATILGGAGGFASKWLQYQNTGILPGGSTSGTYPGDWGA